MRRQWERSQNRRRERVRLTLYVRVPFTLWYLIRIGDKIRSQILFEFMMTFVDLATLPFLLFDLVLFWRMPTLIGKIAKVNLLSLSVSIFYFILFLFKKSVFSETVIVWTYISNRPRNPTRRESSANPSRCAAISSCSVSMGFWTSQFLLLGSSSSSHPGVSQCSSVN